MRSDAAFAREKEKLGETILESGKDVLRFKS
jgi:hypothetical protein